MKKEKSQVSILKKLLSKNTKEKTNIKWVLTIMALAFSISILFSIISDLTIGKSGIIVGIIVLILFIFIGIFFDLVGVAVATSNETPFHSMASRKVSGAKTAIMLKKRSDKVSSICNDVIGDICGIISGSCGVIIINELSKYSSINPFIISLIVTGLIASLTIGGKAMCKSIAINNSDVILYELAKVISIFVKEK